MANMNEEEEETYRGRDLHHDEMVAVSADPHRGDSGLAVDLHQGDPMLAVVPLHRESSSPAVAPLHQGDQGLDPHRPDTVKLDALDLHFLIHQYDLWLRMIVVDDLEAQFLTTRSHPSSTSLERLNHAVGVIARDQDDAVE